MKPQLQRFALALIILLALCYAKTNAQCSEFYGMTAQGGEYNTGTIFKIDGNGDNLITVFNPFKFEGQYPFTDLCEASNGKFYGTTSEGGANNKGVLFEFDPATDRYIIKLDFNGEENGSNPWGSLMQADNGKLYGTTIFGGTIDGGAIFEWDPAINTYTKKYDFVEAENGYFPYSSLIQADNGKLYGMTYGGGTNGYGVIFEWDPATDSYFKKLDFNGVENGSNPTGSLIQANNGKLYGMTIGGGAYSVGVLFEWDPLTDTCIKKIDFDFENGVSPNGSLIQADNGKLYGMTIMGGVYGRGILFEWDPLTDSIIKKLDFNGVENGSSPWGSLMQADNGNLYGMTSGGGVNDCGVLFEWDPAIDTYTKKLDFNGAENGGSPLGSLMQAGNGNLFGMTWKGGATDCGLLFEWVLTTDTYIKKIDFNFAEDVISSEGSLMLAGNGKLYGMSTFGGANAMGVLFELDTATSTYTKKLEFNGEENGSYPHGSLIQADSGKLFGMTAFGGANDMGVLFEWDPNTNTYNKKLDFNGEEKGSYPQASLMQANNGMLYGMTYGGGENNWGTLFEWNPATDTYTKKIDFSGIENGRNPRGSLMQAGDGKLYGMTWQGGMLGIGVLFEWDLATNTIIKKIEFNDENGNSPTGSLLQAGNGKLYGVTYQGGTNDFGVLFEWDPVTDTYTKKLNFNVAENGGYPQGSLMQAGNGMLYGMTYGGGANDDGVLFEWDPSMNTYTKKIDFDKTTNGSNPTGSLMEILYNSSSSAINAEDCKSYTSPSGKYTWTTSGIYKDFIPNAAGCDSIITVNLTINNTTSTINPSACDSYTSPSGKYTWTISGAYKDTIPNAVGCDSIITVILTINRTTSTINPTSCDNYTSPSGRYNWTSSGTYLDTIPSAAGCDSIITVNLTIVTVDTSVIQNQEVLTANATDSSYQWIDCDNGNAPISGETYRTYRASADGNYAVIVSKYGCTDTSACYSVHLTGLIVNTFKNDITLYPNPNNGSFTIDLGSVYSDVIIAITELDGRIIQRENSNQSQILNLKMVAPPGIYMITITCENERAIFKIVKN